MVTEKLNQDAAPRKWLSTPPKELMDSIRVILKRVKVPPTRFNADAFYGRRKYRGEVRCVVGYDWCRAGAHHANGRVYETILGWGETYEDALLKMHSRFP